MKPNESEVENGSKLDIPIDELAQQFFSKANRSPVNDSKLTNQQERPKN